MFLLPNDKLMPEIGLVERTCAVVITTTPRRHDLDIVHVEQILKTRKKNTQVK